MSINRDMRSYQLQKKGKRRTASGASWETWEDKGTIDVAVYKKDDVRISGSEVYQEASHTGLTRCKDIEAYKYRIADGDVEYMITDCNTQGRLTNLLLKVVKSGAR